MNFYINQSICIHQLRIGSLSNSAVLQIGSAGSIQSLSTVGNTGGFTKPAPEAKKPVAAPLVPPVASRQ